MVVVAGIDVSKATLEVSVSEGPVLRFENSATGIRNLLRHLERTGVTAAVWEPTGGYERLVVGKLRETAISVQVAAESQTQGGQGRRGEPQRGLAFCAQEQAEQTGSVDEGLLKERGDAFSIVGDDMG